MPQRNLVILLVAIAAAYACFIRGEQNPFARYVSRSFDTIEANSLERVPNEELFDRAMEAMVGVLNKHGDQHSQFISSADADPFQAEMRQEFGGIGVRIRLLGDPPELVVVGSPDPGTPAARAGIRANDRVLEINDTPTAGLEMNQVLHLMRGKPGEPLDLLLRHADSSHPEARQLVREVISVDSILGDRRNAEGGWDYRLAAEPRIAQVRVTTFGNKTADELQRVLTQLVADGVEAVVLDLRDDAGGSLDAAVAICDMFLPAGKKIVEIRGRDDVVEDRYLSTGRGDFAKLPLAVLVNSGSASASEIVAACLQDNGRAAVFGERSYGKGTVQKLIPIESGRSLLKLTSARYVRPSGKNIHRMAAAKDTDDWGVSPDAGHDVSLSSGEYDAFVEYRSLRDLWGELPPAELLAAEKAKVRAAEGAKSEEFSFSGEFVDRPLAAAVEYLQRLLDRSAIESNSA
ncbi:MAG: S41 family peptidase [Pirellulales bacterium]